MKTTGCYKEMSNCLVYKKKPKQSDQSIPAQEVEDVHNCGICNFSVSEAIL
jgi:hypothetical protein